MQKPRQYESYFILNKKRQYQKSTDKGSLQLSLKALSHQGKKLKVTSRCHRILWDNDKENSSKTNLKTYFTGRKIAQQQLQENTVRIQTIRPNKLYSNQFNLPPKPVNSTTNSQKYQIKIEKASDYLINPRKQQNQERSQIIKNYGQSPSFNRIGENQSLESSSISLNSSSIMRSQLKKSHIKQFKQQINRNLNIQEPQKTQVIKNRTSFIPNIEQIDFKSFPKDQLESSYYVDDQTEPKPHKLIMLSARRGINSLKNDRKQLENYAKTVRDKESRIQQIHSGQDLNKNPNSMSVILDRNSYKPQKNGHRISQDMAHSIHPNQNHQSRYSTQVHEPLKQLINTKEVYLNTIEKSAYQNDQNRKSYSLYSNQYQLPLMSQLVQPKPCQSIILSPSDPNQLQSQNISLEALYQQQFKRRQQANSILKSLINRKIGQENII